VEPTPASSTTVAMRVGPRIGPAAARPLVLGLHPSATSIQQEHTPP
jgi:hypothetical protein